MKQVVLAKAYQDRVDLRQRGHTPRWWVSELPGDGGVDWGWTDKPEKAMLLTPYWQRRFTAHGRACGWKYFGLVDVGNDAEIGEATTQERAAELSEYLEHKADAERTGSAEPGKVADTRMGWDR